MKPPPYVVVGGWAAALTVLALVLLGFTLGSARSTPLVAVLYLGGAGLVATFGLVAWRVARRDGEHTIQTRQPRRATAAAFLAGAIAVAALGLAYGWLLVVLAVYPLVIAGWMLRGERLGSGVRPEPLARADAPVAPPPPPPPPAPSTPSPETSAVVKAGLVVVAARVAGRLLSGRR